jgi:hypothetical protein
VTLFHADDVNTVRSERSEPSAPCNGAIAERLILSRKTVETHVIRIFLELGIRESADHHRRVPAVPA